MAMDEQDKAILRENRSRFELTHRHSLDKKSVVGKETAQSRDADAILAITTRMLDEHLGVSSCAYADMDPDQDGFTIRGDWAAPGAVHVVGHYSLTDFDRLAVKNLGAGQPLIVNDNLVELEPHEATTFRAIGIGATICMPLVNEERLTALMAIHHKGPHIWTPDELALLTEVTERSWAHIERVLPDVYTGLNIRIRIGDRRQAGLLNRNDGKRSHQECRIDPLLTQGIFDLRKRHLMYAAVMYLAITGYVLNRIFLVLEARFIPWMGKT
jgi:GAF domain-containing protein